MSEEILAQESEETTEEEVVEPSEQDSSDDLTEEEVESVVKYLNLVGNNHCSGKLFDS